MLKQIIDRIKAHKAKLIIALLYMSSLAAFGLRENIEGSEPAKAAFLIGGIICAAIAFTMMLFDLSDLRISSSKGENISSSAKGCSGSAANLRKSERLEGE